LLFRGVDVDGPDRPPEEMPNRPVADVRSYDRESVLTFGGAAAHVYSECSGIWNPIHTDAAFARANGLDGIILHGTATLGFAVSTVLALDDLPPTQVRRVAGSFRSVIALPSRARVRVGARLNSGYFFEVLSDRSKPAIAQGWVGIREQEDPPQP
jgi:acyl dehydratase